MRILQNSYSNIKMNASNDLIPESDQQTSTLRRCLEWTVFGAVMVAFICGMCYLWYLDERATPCDLQDILETKETNRLVTRSGTELNINSYFALRLENGRKFLPFEPTSIDVFRRPTQLYIKLTDKCAIVLIKLEQILNAEELSFKLSRVRIMTELFEEVIGPDLWPHKRVYIIEPVPIGLSLREKYSTIRTMRGWKLKVFHLTIKLIKLKINPTKPFNLTISDRAVYDVPALKS